LLAAAWGATLVSSAPAWVNVKDVLRGDLDRFIAAWRSR
jgi:hypothetical protein